MHSCVRSAGIQKVERSILLSRWLQFGRTLKENRSDEKETRRRVKENTLFWYDFIFHFFWTLSLLLCHPFEHTPNKKKRMNRKGAHQQPNETSEAEWNSMNFSTIFTTFAKTFYYSRKWNKTKQTKMTTNQLLTNFWMNRVKMTKRNKTHSAKRNCSSVVNKYKGENAQRWVSEERSRKTWKSKKEVWKSVFAKCHIGKLFEFYFVLLRYPFPQFI